MFIKKFQKKLATNNVVARKKRKYFVSIYRGRVSKSAPPPQIAPVFKKSPAGYFGKSIYGIYKELTGLDMPSVFRILLSSLLAENVGFVSSL